MLQHVIYTKQHASELRLVLPCIVIAIAYNYWRRYFKTFRFYYNYTSIVKSMHYAVNKPCCSFIYKAYSSTVNCIRCTIDRSIDHLSGSVLAPSSPSQRLMPNVSKCGRNRLFVRRLAHDGKGYPLYYDRKPLSIHVC